MSSKILFIWDNKREYRSRIDNSLIKNYLNSSGTGLSRDVGGTEYCFINSNESFDEFKAKANKPKYNSVFILAEPQWDENANSWHGYEVLEYLLEKSDTLLDTSSKHFRLGVFSIFDRRIVHSMISPELRRFVEAFPPIKLNFEIEEKVNNQQFDKSSFEFLQKQSIDVYAILDSLEHSIAHCFGETDAKGDRFDGFVASFHSKKYAMKLKELSVFSEVGRLIDEIKNLHAEIDIANKKKLCNDIETLLKTAKIAASGNKETIDPKNEKTLKDRHIMIIEDDEPMQNKIAEWLGENGASTRSFSLGSRAIEEFEIYRNKKSSSPYHAVITDFEIKDGVFYDVQGTRIIQYIRNPENGFSHIAFRLLTSMGKNTVASTDIFADIDTKHIIYKRDNSIVPIGGDSDKIIKELAEEIYLNQQNSTLAIGKKTGTRKFIDHFFGLDEMTRKNSVSTIIELFISNSYQSPFVFGTRNPKDVSNITDTHINSFLYNRLAVILCCLDKNKEHGNSHTFTNVDDLRKYLAPGKKNKISQSLIRNLGLNLKNNTIKELQELKTTNGLFEHEKKIMTLFVESKVKTNTTFILEEYMDSLA